MTRTTPKRRPHENIIRDCPFCVYCGGQTPSSTVEHMPPKIIFRRKQRLKGLEFASCRPCNNGSSHADLVAGVISRTHTRDIEPSQADELGELLGSVRNNIPGLLEEMFLPPDEEERQLQELPNPEAIQLLRIGPIVNSYMKAFSLKLGLALHYEKTGVIVPPAGGVSVRWFTNHDRVTGAFPQSIFDHLLPLDTLRAGRQEASDQFQYSWRLTDTGDFGMYFASFREAFAVVAFTALDYQKLANPQLEVRTPTEVGQLLATLSSRP